MSTLAQVADALEDKLNDITGLRVYDYVPAAVNVPCVILSVGEIERQTMGRASMMFTFDAAVLLSRGSERVAQQSLYTYASFSGASSIWKQIDDNHTLGLSDVEAKVMRYRPLGIEEIAAYGYVGGVFEIIIVTGA
jgi:hypothetical protein